MLHNHRVHDHHNAILLPRLFLYDARQAYRAIESYSFSNHISLRKRIIATRMCWMIFRIEKEICVPETVLFQGLCRFYSPLNAFPQDSRTNNILVLPYEHA